MKSFLKRVVSLHKDEDGMEAIQVVAIVAIAAVVLVFVKTTLWPRVQSFADEKTSELTATGGGGPM